MDHRIRSAGHRLLLDPSVAIQWRARPTLGALFRQYRRYGRGKADVAWTHPGSIKLRHLAAPALVAALGGAAVLSARRPAIGLAVAAPYVAALTGASVVAARRDGDLSAAPLVAASFATMHTAWGIGMYEGVLSRVSATLGRVSAGRSA
jgi:succinoglycan biosynthesis protein ExoA